MFALKQLQALADKILTAALAAKFELETFNARNKRRSFAASGDQRERI